MSSLTPNTEYLFRCRAVCSVGKGPVSKDSGPITTLPTSPPGKPQADSNSRDKLINSASPSVYKLPLKEEAMDIDGCRSYSFGKESFRRNRTIMVLGAAGSGKSTLINGMINYIVGVEWKDSFRFKLTDEGQLRSQAESQTSEITVYKVNHQEGFKIPYSLTIVDTPGFGDTRGIERDRAITEQIRSLFSSAEGVSEIDAVYFVTQASLPQLTPTQKYVFDSVLSIFGKDVAENIQMLVTFADGQRPLVLEAINVSGVPCPKTDAGLPVHFKFNNSALMGAKSMKNFFTALDKIPIKTLQMTKEVLKERKQLETAVEDLQLQVKDGLAKLEEIKIINQKFQEHEAAIFRNENFEIEVEIIKPKQIQITNEGEYITNCQQCSMTCHYTSEIPEDQEMHRCPAMKDGRCTVCPGKCVWTVHFNQKYRWEYVTVKEKRTLKDLKEKYEQATQAKLTVQEVIKKQEQEIANLQDEIMSLIEESARSIARLNEIALRPNPLSTPEYIDLLIEGEKSEAKEGYLARIQSLEAMREGARIISKVSKRGKGASSKIQYFPQTTQLLPK
uniref:Fibronectin type-III domain-containing protein n=1 Tax=Myripristis murdjan TaxID=586833 RepID=A0A667ZJD1_9TELE